jgi:7-keto-8-aminopelargonate synthetase-like enzyme
MGVGAGASRLVTGSRLVHKELEEEVASWKGTERSVLFPTGYQANIGLLGSLGEDDVLICSDELNHASIIDGCRLSRARVEVYRHLDIEHLDSILSGWRGMAMIVSDLVFSMDGDTAPVAELAALCRRYDALLVLDEAHHVIGPDPGSLLEGVTVLRVGTLSKTLGAQGGVVAGPSLFIQLLENVARSYIFSTALSPVVTSAALAAIRVYRSPEGDRLRSALVHNVNELGGDSQIIPVVIGSEEDAVRVSSELLAMGMWVPAIRPPTVPVGTSRLRVSLSADHSIDQVRALRNALDRLGL